MEKTYSHSQRNNNFNQCSSYSDNKRGRRKSRQGILELLTSYMLRRAMWSVLLDCESGKNSLSYNENQIGATKGVNEKKTYIQKNFDQSKQQLHQPNFWEKYSQNLWKNTVKKRPGHWHFEVHLLCRALANNCFHCRRW